jgi:hypothetical protein
MTQKEQLIARKLYNAIDSIKSLVDQSANKEFFVSHLTQLSRLQREVLAEILADLGLIETVHSGARSPYRIMVSSDQWTLFVEMVKKWSLTVAGNLPKKDKQTVPDSLFDFEIKEIEPSSISDEDIKYWARLFGQARVAIGSKAIIIHELSRVSPGGLTVEDIANILNLSRRTTTDYLKEGFNEGLFAVCFPKENIQSIGYRTDAKSQFLIDVWKDVVSLRSPTIKYASVDTPKQATVTGDI